MRQKKVEIFTCRARGYRHLEVISHTRFHIITTIANFKIMKNIILLIICISMISSCARNSSKKYEDFLEDDVIAMSASDFIHRFGKPDSINKVAGSEVWAYGPKFDDIKNAKKGDLIGVSVVVSGKGFIIRCDAIHRDM